MLWDKKTNTIVNNESSEIIRMFNSEFNNQLPADKAAIDIYPEALRGEIDALNEWVYDTVNSESWSPSSAGACWLMRTADGVYKSGFATTQAAYEKAVHAVFESLDRLEKILEGKNYLVGNVLTEADIRLFVTIVGYDAMASCVVGTDVIADPLRSCLCRTLQVQFPHHSWWIS